VSVVANVAINVDARGAAEQLKRIRDGALGSSQAFKTLEDRAKAVKAAVEASQGGFAKASTVQGVFSANVRNTEQAIRAQIAALRQVQSTVQLGGALYQKAAAQIKDYETALENASKSSESFGAKIKALGGGLIGQLAAATGAAITLQKAFDTLSQQSQAEAALKSLGVDAADATLKFEALSKELRGQASTVELTAAAYDVASAGFMKTADQAEILRASTKGAVGGMSDINTVGNAVTSVLNSYGMSASQAGKLVDGFIQTQNDGKIILAEYATQIGRLAPTAAAAGVGIDELNAAVATITAQGVPVEATFTGLNQALVSILKPTKEAEDLAKSLGIEFNETGLKTKGFGGLLQDVAQKTGGSTTKLVQLFGSVDALKAVLPLVNDNLVKFSANLQKQKEAAGISDKAFQDMAETISGAIKEVDTAFKNLVVAARPITPAFIAPFKILAGTLTLVADNFKAIVQAATFLGTFSAVINASAIATKAWALATQGLAAAKKAAGVAAAFLQAVLNPANIAKIALALGVATGAAVALGYAMGESATKGQAVKDKQSEIATETAKTNTKIDKQLQGLEKIPSRQQAQSDKAKEVLSSYKEQQLSIDAQIASLTRGASITAARYEVEKAILDLRNQELEREYNLAQTAEQRLNIAAAIFQNQVQAAEIEYRQALENIALEQRKLELQLRQEQLKYRQIEAEGKLITLKAAEKDSEAERARKLKDALATQGQVVAAAQENLGAQQQIAAYQKQAAETQYQSKVLTAQTGLEQKLVSDKIGLSQEQATRLSNELANGAIRSHDLANNTERVSQNAYNASGNFISVANAADRAATAIHGAANAQERLNAAQGGGGGGAPQQAADGAYWSGGFKAFAEGGVVTKPTMGIVGEGGEPEYIIPASKMAEAMQRYASGQRGSSVIPSSINPQVSVTTGPVMNMGGTNFVSQQDFMMGMQTASRRGAEMAIQLLQGNNSVRRRAGVA